MEMGNIYMYRKVPCRVLYPRCTEMDSEKKNVSNPSGLCPGARPPPEGLVSA
jgi:hypothetical protein